MRPARLGGGVVCAAAVLALLPFSPACRAQAVRAQPVVETPQQVNDRLRELSASLRMMPHDYVIGPGDLLNIYVFDVEELSREVRVSQTGTIGIPLVPVRLHVAGLTEMQTEQKIAEVLEANGLVTHADVSVTVKEHKSKPITVVGAVSHPMVYQADRPVTVLEVLAEAGGVANDAGDTVIVNRPSQEASSDPLEPPAIGPEGSAPVAAPSDTAVSKPSANPAAPADTPAISNTLTINLNELMESGDAANNIILLAGDIVTGPHSGIVYVLGAVGRPGGFVLANDRGQMTTLKVLALAGGLNSTAKRDHAVIVRKDTQGQQHEVAVDLKKVMARQAEDVQLQPSDILYVPDSAARKAMLRTVELGIALGTGIALHRVAYR